MDKARLFAALPYPLKKVAAAARGYYLERWRYDERTAARASAAAEREGWDAERWRHWHEEKLARLLGHAAREVPFYRQWWSGRRGHGQRSDVELLANWPVLGKEALRRDPRAFLADGATEGRLFRESTSGSTGTPLQLFWDEEATKEWYALVEARCRRWHGLSREDRWAILGGQPIVRAGRRRPPFWVWNSAMHQLYLSSSHLAPDLIPAYLEALRDHGVRWIYGYSSALDTLASFGEGHAGLGLRLAMSNAEPLYAHQRERIAGAFACPVRETYGMAELVAAASECPEGRLHLWPEAGVAELLHEDGSLGPARPGECGELVATGLLNSAQPLVRYRVGDRLRFAAADATCACGRRLPLLEAIEGRNDDLVLTLDGRRLGRLDPIFKGGLPIREAQIVQETLSRLRLRLVPAPGYGEATEAELRRRFRDRVGAMELEIDRVGRLERTTSGKLRGVVSLLSPGSPETSGGQDPGPGPRPLLSIILPVRNEAKFIEKSLASVLGQTVGIEKLEILLVDGLSDDATRQLAVAMFERHGKNFVWRILDNPRRSAPCAMNVGILAARGEFLARVDGHAELAPDYFERALALLAAHPGAAGVGGRMVTLGSGPRAEAIAAAMSSSFGVGGAAFRLPGPPGSVKEADTVAFPVYRRQALDQNGFFDEQLKRNQDDEYNFRLRKAGWKILLAESLGVKYYSRSTFARLFSQYFEYGVYKVRVLQKHPLQMSPRHFVPFAFVLGLLAGLAFVTLSPLPLAGLSAAWLGAAGLAGWGLARRERWGAGAAVRLPLAVWAFFLLHLAYGAGFAVGLGRFGRGFFGGGNSAGEGR